MRDIEPEEDLSEPGRYKSVDNWDPYKKQRKAAAKITRDFLAEPPNPFRQLNGDDLAKTWAPIKEPKQLFGNLWREGEVAILFGETATGKSILATQIAESIARGTSFQGRVTSKDAAMSRSPLVTRGSSLPAQPVLYFDFERTLAQFQERYSVRRSPTSDRRIKYKFFRNFNRLDLEYIDDVASEIKGDLNLFCRNAVRRQIEQSEARVVIIDNISYLSPGTGNATRMGLIKNLKLWANLYNVSILAVAHKRDRERSRPLSLADLPPYASLADTVFAIAPSSMSPDIRYIKHLKSTGNADPRVSSPHVSKGSVDFQRISNALETLVFRLERLSEPGFCSPPAGGGVDAASADGVVGGATGLLSSPPAGGGVDAASADGVVGGATGLLSSPPARGGVDAASADGVVGGATGLLSSPPARGGVDAASADGVVVSPSAIKNSQLSSINSQFPPHPFIGLTHLGYAAEQEHLRDYEREARDAHNREQKRLREWHRSSKEARIQGYFDGSYARYLND
jgi:hypothetical protein